MLKIIISLLPDIMCSLEETCHADADCSIDESSGKPTCECKDGYVGNGTYCTEGREYYNVGSDWEIPMLITHVHVLYVRQNVCELASHVVEKELVCLRY